MNIDFGIMYGDGPPMVLLPNDEGLLDVTFKNINKSYLRKGFTENKWGDQQVAIRSEIDISEQAQVAGTTALLYGFVSNFLSPGAKNLFGGGLGLMAIAGLYGWFYAEEELVEIAIDEWEQTQEILWEIYEEEFEVTRWDMFNFAVIDYELQQLGKTGQYSLALDWYKMPETSEQLHRKFDAYQTNFSGLPTPPPYIDRNVLHQMKRSSKNKKYIFTISFLLFIFFWRKKKKGKTGWFSPK